ncbi:SpoIIE family protein phosphatase [Parafrankia sp. CH37]|uniref:SpoIIE family protein phosphatase n=1 Tax=Parafrankia sp. CH37 TaxID=683308 RepID=UPI00289C6016|nr:SpoIIE family protein phosphatase [Parafrankia sp. CH37]
MVVGDVSGHGAVAGVFALRLKQLLDAALARGADPGPAIEWVVNSLGETDEMFATAIVAVVDPRPGRSGSRTRAIRTRCCCGGRESRMVRGQRRPGSSRAHRAAGGAAARERDRVDRRRSETRTAPVPAAGGAVRVAGEDVEKSGLSPVTRPSGPAPRRPRQAGWPMVTVWAWVRSAFRSSAAAPR